MHGGDGGGASITENQVQNSAGNVVAGVVPKPRKQGRGYKKDLEARKRRDSEISGVSQGDLTVAVGSKRRVSDALSEMEMESVKRSCGVGGEAIGDGIVPNDMNVELWEQLCESK